MTFKIQIPQKEYSTWSSYFEWYNGVGCEFTDWCGSRFPEIIYISDLEVSKPIGLYRIFKFKSEEHYHWFLLQQ
jgi:hypothetical protein